MAGKAENKITYGLENAYYALFDIGEDGTITYQTPIAIPGAVELEITARGDMIEFYADNMVYYSSDNNQGYEGTLKIANIPQSFSTGVLGEVLDDTDQVIHEVANAVTKPFALLFQFEGDVKAIRHVLYNCSASRPTVSSSTKTDTVEPNENELSFIANPRSTDKRVKTRTTTNTSDTIYDNWFKNVYEKAAA